MSSAFGQSASLALTSATTTSGGNASLNLSLTAPAGGGPAAIQWAFTYAASDIAAISATAGTAATAAGKSISCSRSAGSYLCLVSGVNSNVISNGVVATVSVTLSATVTTSTSISVTNTIGASPAGAVISLTASGGTITVGSAPPLDVSGLTCNPASVITPGTSTCTVTLTRHVVSKTGVSLRDDQTSLTMPPVVVVSAGSSSANFTVNASPVSAAQNVVLTATVSGNSKTTRLILIPPLTVTSLQCNPSSVKFGGKSTCIVKVNRAVAGAIQIPITTNNSSALLVPSSVSLPENAVSVPFSVTAGNIAGQFAVIAASSKRALINVTGTQSGNKSDTSVSKLSCSSGSCADEGAIPTARVDELSCAPKAVNAGDRITCRVQLASVPDVLTLKATSSSGDLQVPAAIETRAMQSSLSFQGYTSLSSKQQSVVLQIASGASVVQDSVMILPSSNPVLHVPGKQMVKAGTAVNFTVIGGGCKWNRNPICIETSLGCILRPKHWQV